MTPQDLMAAELRLECLKLASAQTLAFRGEQRMPSAHPQGTDVVEVAERFLKYVLGGPDA